MKNIEKVEFVFENCESFEIDAKYFGQFHVENIYSAINRIACNSIAKMQIANTIAFEIFSEGNIPYSPFGGQEQQNKFDRISAFSDITSIVLIYEDGSTEQYYVNYDDGGNYGLGVENKNQKSYISTANNLYLIIQKDTDIFQFFNKEEIDDKEYIDSFKGMILE